jgi:aryl-alcohol dehydrogenase
MGCGFQTGAGAVFNAIKPVENNTRSLAIFGTGGVGFAAIMAALSLARENQNILQKIIAVDINNSRLELARQLGTTHTINSATEDLAARIHEITDGEGLDAAIDCSGVVPVITQMISLLGPGGQAVSVGAPPPGKTVEVDTFNLLVTAKTYQGCHQGNANSKEVCGMNVSSNSNIFILRNRSTLFLYSFDLLLPYLRMYSSYHTLLLYILKGSCRSRNSRRVT